MRVLIAGCGYVGLALGKVLANQGHEVFGLRRHQAAEGELHAAGIHPLAGDITKPEELARLPASYHWVIQCAAASGGGAENYRRVYFEGAQNLIQWVRRAPPAQFVYTSSTSVYGQTDGSWVHEGSPTDPEAGTAKVLVETEAILIDAARKHHFPAIVLRVAGIYGPDRGYWFKAFLNGEARIEGDGTRMLNMVHRDDVAGAIIAALERGRPGEVYNVVDDEPISQLACFQWLSDKFGKPLPPTVPAVLERKRGVTNKKVSNRRLKEELGYQFKYPTFREGHETGMTGWR